MNPPTLSPERLATHLPAEPGSTRQARRFVSDVLGRWSCPHLAEEAALLTSELVTNAIRYGGSRALLEAAAPDGVLRVSVRDDNPALPVVGLHPDLTAESGRGLQLVSALADDWGVESADGGGKAVWFELRLEQSSQG